MYRISQWMYRTYRRLFTSIVKGWRVYGNSLFWQLSAQKKPIAPPQGEGAWPLLTVETEANGDSWSTYVKGPSLIGSLGSSCRYNKFLSCFGWYCYCTKYYFPSRTLFHFISPHHSATWAGSRAGSPFCTLSHIHNSTPKTPSPLSYICW